MHVSLLNCIKFVTFELKHWSQTLLKWL